MSVYGIQQKLRPYTIINHAHRGVYDDRRSLQPNAQTQQSRESTDSPKLLYLRDWIVDLRRRRAFHTTAENRQTGLSKCKNALTWELLFLPNGPSRFSPCNGASHFLFFPLMLLCQFLDALTFGAIELHPHEFHMAQALATEIKIKGSVVCV